MYIYEPPRVAGVSGELVKSHNNISVLLAAAELGRRRERREGSRIEYGWRRGLRHGGDGQGVFVEKANKKKTKEKLAKRSKTRVIKPSYEHTRISKEKNGPKHTSGPVA